MMNYIRLSVRALLILTFLILSQTAQAQYRQRGNPATTEERTYFGSIAIFLQDGTIRFADQIYLSDRVYIGAYETETFFEPEVIDRVEILPPSQDSIFLFHRLIPDQEQAAWLRRMWTTDRMAFYERKTVDWAPSAMAGVAEQSVVRCYYYSKDGGPLAQATMENAMQDVADSPKTLRKVKNAQHVQVVSLSLGALGVANIVGVLISLATGDEDLGIAFAAGGVASLGAALMVGVSSEKSLEKALKRYR